MKAETRRALREVGMKLFSEKGYEKTTVEEIAAAAGVSHMTFFRHFRSKDHLVLTEDYDDMLVENLKARPDGESVAEMVRAALLQSLMTVYPERRDELLERWSLVLQTPALLAMQARRNAIAQNLVIEGLARRSGDDATTLNMHVEVSACIAAATTTCLWWAQRKGIDSLLELINEAFDAIHLM